MAAGQDDTAYRTEHDSMGEVRVPAWAKWRAQTQRAVENFPISGTPIERELIAACALKCMGGGLQGRLWPRDDEERQKAIDAGHDLDRVLQLDDLVRGDVFFVATGITDGELLRGVQYRAGEAD